LIISNWLAARKQGMDATLANALEHELQIFRDEMNSRFNHLIDDFKGMKDILYLTGKNEVSLDSKCIVMPCSSNNSVEGLGNGGSCDVAGYKEVLIESKHAYTINSEDLATFEKPKATAISVKTIPSKKLEDGVIITTPVMCKMSDIDSTNKPLVGLSS